MEKEKSCGAIVCFENKILLVKTIQGIWGFPKGHIIEGETEEQTTIREVKEETGLDVIVNSQKRYEIEYQSKKNTIKTLVIFESKALNNNIQKQDSELEDYVWVEKEEALNIITYDDLKEILIKNISSSL